MFVCWCFHGGGVVLVYNAEIDFSAQHVLHTAEVQSYFGLQTCTVPRHTDELSYIAEDAQRKFQRFKL